LARTLALPEDPLQAAAEISRNRAIPSDVIRLQSGGEERYALNAVTAGFSALVDEALEPRSKELLGRVSFLLTAGRALPELETHRLRLTVDNGDERRFEAVNLVLANGRTVGGGVPVAVNARLDDGLLRLLVVPAMPVAALAAAMARLMAEGADGVEGLHTETVRRIRFDSEPEMQLTADGEVLGTTPAEANVLPNALRCVIGNESTARRATDSREAATSRSRE
jgi:diacylglycerol kinase (ATP)